MTLAVNLIASNLFLHSPHQLLTSYLSHQRYGAQNKRTITDRCFVLTLTKTFTSTHSVVNQRLFHHHGHQYLVLVSFLCVQLSTKSNSTRISLLPRQSPTPLDRLLFKLSMIIVIISVKLDQQGRCLTLSFA